MLLSRAFALTVVIAVVSPVAQARAQDSKLALIITEATGAPAVGATLRQACTKALGTSIQMAKQPQVVSAAKTAGFDAQSEDPAELGRAAKAAGLTHIARAMTGEDEGGSAGGTAGPGGKFFAVHAVLVEAESGRVLSDTRLPLAKRKLDKAVAEQWCAAVLAAVTAPVAPVAAVAEPVAPVAEAAPAPATVETTPAETAAAAPSDAAAPAPAPEVITATGVSAGDAAAPVASDSREIVLGLNMREVVGYGAMVAGGALAITGAVTLLTRDGMSTTTTGDTIVVRGPESRAAGATMTTAGLGLVAVGAAVLWIDMLMEVLETGPSTAHILPVPGGLVLTSTF